MPSCSATFTTISILLSVLPIFGLELNSIVCGNDHFSYSTSSGEKVFYVNGYRVEKQIFCHSLGLQHVSHCFFEEHLGYHDCTPDLHSDELSFESNRKLLQGGVKREAIHEENHTRNDENRGRFPITSKMMAMAVPGVLLMGCAFLYPCFRSKKKDDFHTTLQKELNSLDSASSCEHNSSRKVQASPLRHPPPSPRFAMSPQHGRLGSVHLTYSQIAKATQNFSPNMLIGEGGFGSVYKAQLPEGQIVAIKRARKELFDSTEFSSEVEILSKIDHRHLVKLLGYVDKGNERIIITEYVTNGTLRQHLDGEHKNILDFNQRLEIAINVAHGLTYLHLYADKPIIHRDVKSSNILLTETLRAKVADFGFARLGPVDVDHTHISTKVKGTVGYVDPEYMRTFQLTTKSDVYSFGILLLEILTGRRPVEPKRPPEERVTLRWVFYNFKQGNVAGLIDPLMDEIVDTRILKKLFGLAIQCAAPVRNDRPDMDEVGVRLGTIRTDYIKSNMRG